MVAAIGLGTKVLDVIRDVAMHRRGAPPQAAAQVPQQQPVEDDEMDEAIDPLVLSHGMT